MQMVGSYFVLLPWYFKAAILKNNILCNLKIKLVLTPSCILDLFLKWQLKKLTDFRLDCWANLVYWQPFCFQTSLSLVDFKTIVTALLLFKTADTKIHLDILLNI